MKPQILLSVKNNEAFYVDAVKNSGGVPFAEYCPTAVDDYNGLILTGGSDISPSYYGEEINGSVNIDDIRDAAEFALVKAFADSGKPIMGICRGCQLLNIFFGGSLVQNIANAEIHSSFGKGYLVHPATATDNNFIKELYGKDFYINSSHHQAINRLGDGLEAVLYSSDGIIEAVIHKKLPIFGVQFHPERMCFSAKRDDTVDGKALFEYFINLCKNNSI